VPIRLVATITAVILIFTFYPASAYAQYGGSGGTQGQQPSLGPRKQMATIIFAGLAGAILGLSTLSFYGRPQDKLPNIGMGLAVGIISGTIYTTYLAATRPKTYFEGLVPSIEEERIMGSTLAMRVDHRPAVQLQFEWDF
jgi:NhaP-type Na+/H+ or K+/H+ antiporter